MAQALTIARPYARAAYAVASANDTVAAWLAWLTAFAAVARDDEYFRHIATHPLIAADDVSAAVIGAFGDALDDDMRRFVAILAVAGRLSMVAEIATVFVLLDEAAQNRRRVLVDSPFPLDEMQQQTLVTALRRFTGSDIVLDVRENPALIGGVRIRIGDTVIDTSVRAALARLTTALLR